MKNLVFAVILSTCGYSLSLADLCKTDLAKDGCSLTIVCGDKPGIVTTLFRTCETMSKKQWAAQMHLDTTVVSDSTKVKKDSTKTK